MDITLIAIGSRGDVQPFLALARALRHVGHCVRLAAPPDFAGLASSYGVELVPAGVDVQRLLDNERVRDILESGSLVRSLLDLRREVVQVIDDLLLDVWRACQGSQAIIATVIWPVGYSVAERLGVPYVEVVLQPFTPTRAFASPAVPPGLRLGGTLNRLSHTLFEQALWQLCRANINRLRREVLGLPPHPLTGPFSAIRARGTTRLYAFSPHVVPPPHDWPASHVVTGYWFLPPPPGWQPPADLQEFLAAGEPPVYVGFGSMVARSPEQTTALVLEALERAGVRGVLAGGWGGLQRQGLDAQRVFYLDSVPHSWLFPRMAAVVHHGGAGTTAAGLASGVPSIVVPHSFDQPFWGWRAAALGAGPRPLPRKELSAAQLAQALETALYDPAMRRRAANLGEQIRAEQGLARAVDQLHRVLGARRQAQDVAVLAPAGG